MGFHSLALIITGVLGLKNRQGKFAMIYGVTSILLSMMLRVWEPEIFSWFISQTVFEFIMIVVGYIYLRMSISKIIIMSVVGFCFLLNINEALLYDSYSLLYNNYELINLVMFEVFIAALILDPEDKIIQEFIRMNKWKAIRQTVVGMIVIALVASCTLIPDIPNPLKDNKGIKVSAQVGKTNTQIEQKALAQVKINSTNTDNRNNKAATINQYTEQIPTWMVLFMVIGWALLIPSPWSHFRHKREVKRLENQIINVKEVTNATSKEA